MGAHHYQFKVFRDYSICQQILDCLKFKFVDVDASQVALLLSSDSGVFNDTLHLLIQLKFLGFAEFFDFSFEGS